MILDHGILSTAKLECLAKIIRPSDVIESEAMGKTPLEALMYAYESNPNGMTLVESHSRGHEPVPVGAFGYEGNTIWSLWAKLRTSEAIEMLHLTPEYVRRVVQASPFTKLHNYVHADNTPALKWMAASHCFLIDSDNVMILNNHIFHRFTTRPLQEMPS